MTWQDIEDQLDQWQEGLPVISDSELDGLLATGESLPLLLEASEDQSREAIDAIIRNRVLGDPWPELQASWKMFLAERFGWAFAVASSAAACRIRVSPKFEASSLLIQAWDEAGALHTHDSFPRRHLTELLRHAGGACYKPSGG
jgi:hypothetical protein